MDTPKLEKTKRLMELTGITATLKQDFDILRHPLGSIGIPIELLNIEPGEEENLIDRFAVMYGEHWEESELDVAISFFTVSSAGKKLIDPGFRERISAEFKKMFIDPLVMNLEERFISILPTGKSTH